MLGFIPMIDKAVVYSADIDNADMWGTPTYTKTYVGYCQISHKTDLGDVSALDGKAASESLTVLFKNDVAVKVGDKVEFIFDGKVVTEIVTSVSKQRDWGGKVFSTRVVSGAAKRDY